MFRLRKNHRYKDSTERISDYEEEEGTKMNHGDEESLN